MNKYAMLINRWDKGYTNKKEITIKSDNLDSLCEQFGELKYNNDMTKYEPLDFVKVYKIGEN